ncbi:hypothetical protein [Mycobacterium sp.]|uniref:hypothetical protein n=1 Tax=Mycobacterium sp. TaxID=1785 RepID=UPI0031E2FD27
MTASKSADVPRRSRTKPDTGRTTWDTVEIVATSIVRPVVVTAAVFGAVLGAIPAAHADSVNDAMGPVLNGVGIGNNGPVSGAIAQMGQSICPMLVKPGGSLASSAAEIGGPGGLAPPMVGFLASMAIQTQCPGFMTSVANGNMPFPLPGAGGPGLPLGLPGAPGPQSLLPGINPVGGQPLPLPGF